MNFFEGVLRLERGVVAFEQSTDAASATAETASNRSDGLTNSHKPFTLAIPSQLASKRMLAVGATSAVVLGIRPEHLSLRPIRADDGSIVSQPLTFRRSLIEPIGSSVDLYLQSAGREPIVARVDAAGGNAVSALRVGSPVEVHVDLRRAQLFEPGDTGMNLSLETTRSGQLTEELAHANA